MRRQGRAAGARARSGRVSGARRPDPRFRGCGGNDGEQTDRGAERGLPRLGSGAAGEPGDTWFTEGFDTADLKEEKALLDELTTSVVGMPSSLFADGRFLADATIRRHGHERRLRVDLSRWIVAP